jgi:hypothetical protein
MKMDAPPFACVDVPWGYPGMRMISYKHYTKIGGLHYKLFHALFDNFASWTICYIYHTKMDAQHCASFLDVHSHIVPPEQQHTSHKQWHSSPSIFLCSLISLCCLNDLLYMSHKNGRTPFCACRCHFQAQYSVNDFLHTQHKNGGPSICVRRCVSS